ncbi:MAG: DJ-1/PfpI family protein [Kofleriaceae bacterium]
MALHIGLLLFPDLTQLDLTGPYEVFHRLPDAKVHLVWKDLAPIRAQGGMQLVPNTTLADCPPLDVVCVPGGFGTAALLEDVVVLDWLRAQAKTARFVTAVCTGSLVLAKAGLLAGRKATCHWNYVDVLPKLGAVYEPGRVVVDRDRITGGGVTAGIDFALRVAAELAGEQVAKAIQLGLEYNPAPPFSCGHPDVADATTIGLVKARLQPSKATIEGLV